MHNWRYPNTENIPGDLSDITPEMLSLIEEDYKECNEQNSSKKEELTLLIKQTIITAAEVWGETSNVVKYLKRQHIFTPSHLYINDFKRKVEEAKKKKGELLWNIKREEEKETLVEKAIVWLTERGNVLGVDFTIKTALSYANDIAFDEEVSQQILEIVTTGVNIEFSGNENCEDCSGWNGQDKRCDCGARRVNWTSHEEDDFFLDPYIYGEGY